VLRRGRAAVQHAALPQALPPRLLLLRLVRGAELGRDNQALQ